MAIQVSMTKQGKNVLTETDPNNFIINTNYNTFKIISSGTSTGNTVNSDPKVFTLAHGQSGIPGIFAFAKFPDGYTTLPNGKEKSDTHPVERYWLVSVDSTNIRFTFYKGSSANYNVDISYYIFEVPL